MLNGQSERLDVFIVDSVGAHRGMHYYNFALASALNEIGARVVLISTPATAAHSLRPSNVPVWGGFWRIYGDRPKWLRGLFYLFSLLRLSWWAWRDRPDIVHFHFYQIPLFDYILLRWLSALGIKVITTVHDVLPFEQGTDFASARGKIHHRLYNSSSALILHSRYIQDCLAELDPDLIAKSVVIAHGNYSSLCQQRLVTQREAKVELGIEPSTQVILVFGTIKPNKRLDLVIEAMPDVIQSNPDAKLVVAGKPQDQDMSKYITLVDQLGLTQKVLWRLGYVPDEELLKYFSAADVVVFPYQWIYQSGALLMAMNFAKPIIATSVGSIMDVIQNNETGILVPLGNSKAMAGAIQAVLNDEAKAYAMGRAAREYVTTELSWNNIAESTLAFYRQDGPRGLEK